MSAIARALLVAAFLVGPLSLAHASEELAPSHLIAFAFASDAPTSPVKPDASVPAKGREAQPIVWKPKVTGAPSGRVGGAVRGSSDLATPLALAPAAPGLTVRGVPSLFWHIDGAAPEGVKVFFTLIDERGETPLVETELKPPIRAGIQRIRLSSYGVELKVGETYTWSIALVPDMDNRARDRVSQVPDDGKVPLEARTLAAEGLWYDALELLSDAVDANPGNSEALATRRSLLAQAGILVGAD